MSNGPTGTTATAPATAEVPSTRAVDELASLFRPVAAGFRDRLPEIVAGLAVLVTVLAVLAVAGAALDDRAIDNNPAVAQAEVLEGSSYARTLVRFTAASGEAVVPEHGVSYPRGLRVGDSVAVEYDVTNPELARVAGRTALTGVVPLSIGIVATWLVLGPLAIWLRRRRTAQVTLPDQAPDPARR